MKFIHTLVLFLLLSPSTAFAMKPESGKTQEIDLTQVTKGFKKKLGKKINKKDCEKQVFIKSAKLRIKGGILQVSLRTRITRQYCTRRARTQVFEKTGDTNLNYEIVIVEHKIELQQLQRAEGNLKFNKSFSDVLNGKTDDVIGQALKEIILNESGLSIEPKYDSIQVSDEGKLVITTI